jgi:uroporphyrinogen-III synthase
MTGLSEKTVVLLESRMSAEMAGLVQRHGGTPLPAPAMREVALPQQEGVKEAVRGVAEGRFGMVVLLTGVGARAFLTAAEQLGMREPVLAGLSKTRVVCRGPKPLAVCRQNAIPVYLVAPEPNTSEDLAAALKERTEGLSGVSVLLQHYGAPNEAIRASLEAMGAAVTDLSLYGWDLPENITPLMTAIEALAHGQAQAVLFTSQQQARNLFDVAGKAGRLAALLDALRHRVVVGSVGPVATRTLAAYGLKPDVIPEHPKMGILVQALARYFEEHPDGKRHAGASAS